MDVEKELPRGHGSGHPDWRKVAAIATVVVVVMLLLTARHDRPEVTFDGPLNLPTPPLDAAYSGRNTVISIIWLGAVALLGFGLAIRDYRRTRIALPL